MEEPARVYREATKAESAFPDFTYASYKRLLSNLKGHGHCLLCRDIPSATSERCFFVRHDVDFDLGPAEAMARMEADLGVRATYFIGLTMPTYNLMTTKNRDRLKSIVSLGHEVGLHFDPETYPQDGAEARGVLDREAAILESLAKSPVSSIAMHNPSIHGSRLFEESRDYINPYSPGFFPGSVYISDSCRRWRGPVISDCVVGVPPSRVQLLVHPELWCKEVVEDSMAFLQQLRLHVVSEQELFWDWVATVWREHHCASCRKQDMGLDR